MEKENKLVKGLTLVTLFTLITGAMVGMAWAVLANVFLDRAGPAVLISIGVASVLTLFVGLCFAELCSAMPYAGGAYMGGKDGKSKGVTVTVLGVDGNGRYTGYGAEVEAGGQARQEVGHVMQYRCRGAPVAEEEDVRVYRGADLGVRCDVRARRSDVVYVVHCRRVGLSFQGRQDRHVYFVLRTLLRHIWFRHEKRHPETLGNLK